MNEQISMLKSKPHWVPIERGDRGYSSGDFICSECGKPCPCYHLTKYCPNCGAKMYEDDKDIYVPNKGE